VNPFDPSAPFIQAKHFTWISPLHPRVVNLLELHSEENPDKPGSALAVANWFGSTLSPEASPHACVDPVQVVCCVDPKDISWACGAANWGSYSLECGGYAKWTRDVWLSEGQTPMLGLAASHLKKAAAYFGIPAVLLSDDDVAKCILDSWHREHGVRVTGPHPGGITTHAQTNRVLKSWQTNGLPKPVGDLSHTDPGDGFPLDVLIQMINEEPT
jgi:hypothetical protein